MHNHDVNCNESMDNVIAWLAPKNKLSSGTVSLEGHVEIAVCVQSLGFEVFFRDLLAKMNIDTTEGTKCWLQKSDGNREKHKTKAKEVESKIKRKHICHEKPQEKTEQARADMLAGRGHCKRDWVDGGISGEGAGHKEEKTKVDCFQCSQKRLPLWVHCSSAN